MDGGIEARSIFIVKNINFIFKGNRQNNRKLEVYNCVGGCSLTT